MAGGARRVAGRSFHNGWMNRKLLAETRRPGLVKVLAVCTAAASLLFIAEGILVGWFLSHLIPGLEPLEGMTTRYFDSFLSEAPYVRLPTYLATACLIMIGVAGLIAAFSLLGASRPAAYFTVALVVGLFVTGAVLLVQVIWTNSTLTTVLGSVNLGSGAALAVLLGLCWYTLDPLGLHGEPD